MTVSTGLFATGVQEYDAAPIVADHMILQERVEALTVEVETLRALNEAAEPDEDYYREIGTVPGHNPRAKYYEVPEGFPPIDSRVRFIGNLRGTWTEMGNQYGERAGDLIVNVYRYAVEYFSEKGMDTATLHEYLRRYLEPVKTYAPEMIEFMEGIADGVRWSTAGIVDTDDLSDFEKVFLINVFLDLDFFRPVEGLSSTPLDYQSDFFDGHIASHCTGIALSGRDNGDLLSPTKNGETIVANHYDLARFVPLAWNCAYVATPSDPDAHVIWSIQPAGMVGNQNIATNDAGVTIGSFFGGQSEDSHFDFGVVHPILELHALAYADSAEEAIETMVFGNEAYRAASGRGKVLQTGLWGYLVADRDAVMVLEVTPNWHAVRYPGDMGEVGNYVIYANWYGADHYYDEDNNRVDEPIGIQPPEFPERYWTYDWFVRYHFGELDEELVREGQRSTYYFDQETGRRIDYLEGSTLPLYIGMHTISAYWGAALGMDIGGTIHAAQVIHEANGRTKANWVQGRPAEWLGPWQSTDFYGYLK